LNSSRRGALRLPRCVYRERTRQHLIDDGPLAGGDAWPGDAAASASAAESYSAPIRVICATSAIVRSLACRAARKAASQARWLAQPENHDYFRGPVHLARSRAWRARPPGYWRKSPRPRTASKDVSTTQTIGSIGKTGIFVRSPLQDLLTAQPAVLIGLIARLVGAPEKPSTSSPSSPQP
jgi:hypothetical protein